MAGAQPIFGTTDSPWIRRGSSEASPSARPLTFAPQDYERQGLLGNGRTQDRKGELPTAAAGPSCPACSVSLTHNCSRTPQPPPSLTFLIFEQFIRFCEHTSLRGVPRIVKTKDRKLRCLWSSFFLLLFFGCTFCVVAMVLQYFARDIIQKPVTQSHAPRNFPSVTLCNTRPFSAKGYSLLKERGILRPHNYTQVLINWLKVDVQRLRFSKSDVRYLSNVLSFSSFLNALPEGVSPSQLGHSLNELVLDCSVMYNDGKFVANRPCMEVGLWTQTLHQQFINCFTYTIREKISKTALKVNMTLYLGERVVDCIDCTSQHFTQLEGARAEIHEANTYPNVNEGGLYLNPGMLTEIEFATKEWRLKEPPYGICKKNQRQNITLDAHLFTFSQSACFISELQRKLSRECNCVSFESPVPQEYEHMRRSRKFCRQPIVEPLESSRHRKKRPSGGYFSKEFLRSVVKRLRCRIFVQSQHNYDHDKCPKRCVYLDFQKSVSSTRWPTRIYQDHFLHHLKDLKRQALALPCQKALNLTFDSADHNALHDTNMADCVREARAANASSPHAESFAAIRDTADMFETILRNAARRPSPPANASATERAQAELNRIIRDEYFTDHFISLIVRRPHFGIKVIMEKEVITLTSLLSQVGGLLSIFIGLNFAFLVEVIELLFNICRVVHKKRSIPYY